MDGIQVYVAFRCGVAIVLPAFATRMIEVLGAKPVEEFNVYTPPEVIVRYQRGDAIVLGGQGVQLSSRRAVGQDSMERNFARQPEGSWKRYRKTRWRRIAMAAQA